MPDSIDWKITEQHLTQELVSTDNRWHISKNQNENEPPRFFLTNYDLLLTPHGSGTDYKECFESFITDCDAFIKKISEVKAEMERHLAELKLVEGKNHAN